MRSGNDLKPFRLIAFRYTSVQGSQGSGWLTDASAHLGAPWPSESADAGRSPCWQGRGRGGRMRRAWPSSRCVMSSRQPSKSVARSPDAAASPLTPRCARNPRIYRDRFSSARRTPARLPFLLLPEPAPISSPATVAPNPEAAVMGRPAYSVPRKARSPPGRIGRSWSSDLKSRRSRVACSISSSKAATAADVRWKPWSR